MSHGGHAPDHYAMKGPGPLGLRGRNKPLAGWLPHQGHPDTTVISRWRIGSSSFTSRRASMTAGSGSGGTTCDP